MMQWTWMRRAVATLVTATASGCATMIPPPSGKLAADAPAVQTCTAWFRSLDSAIDQSGVRDAGAHRMPGFPYLRVDRFLASFRETVPGDDEAFGVWITRLRSLDATARGFELRNLPEAELRRLDVTSADEALRKMERCADELRRNDVGNAAARERLLAEAQVPDDYTEWQRVVGLYPLARIPFARGVERWHEQVAEMFRHSEEGANGDQALWRYVPPVSAALVSRKDAAAIVVRSKKDRLGIPILDTADRELLLAAHAPMFEVETTGPYDRAGFLFWQGGPTPAVDTSRPTVYRRLAYTRYGSQTLVQLVYTLWFPERPHDDAFDLLAGKLDGIVVRVTIAPDGEPLVYDSIHPCGCYHMFFPTVRVTANPAPEPGDEWALIPATVPAGGQDARLVLRLATRTHYLTAVGWEVNQRSERAVYAFEEEDSLRSLATGAAARRSIYGPDGLVSGTERTERMLFWPMGIPSAGAMRQWGKHATAFLGRRHFDDADLIERRFTLLPQ